jgi:hypothetical protein
VLLDEADDRGARSQIQAAITRFGLDPSRPADVIAASSYVWSSYNLPIFTDAPFSGPALDAASQAVMRFGLVNPGAFTRVLQDSMAHNMIIDVANAGLSNYNFERRGLVGVDPALQTTSRSARRAIANQLRSGKMQAHHLVPVEVWVANLDISKLAAKDGWKADLPSNLIGLPADEDTQRRYYPFLPMHRGPHPKYNIDTQRQLMASRNTFPIFLTPVRAHAILDSVAAFNRARILGGHYHPIIKVRS